MGNEKKADIAEEKPKPAKNKKTLDRYEMNIYQKIAVITGEIGAVGKDGKNTEQNYSFIEYAAVAGKLRTLFSKYGVVIVPNMPASEKQLREEITTKYGKKGVNVLIDFTFRIVNADNPTDEFTVTWTGEAADYGDKATNKAATAALKYYAMRQFNISEKGEDADGESIDRGEAHQSHAQQPAAAPAPRPQVVFATEMQLKNLAKVLVEKGIRMADTGEMIQKLGKKEPRKLTAGDARQLTDKVRGAKSEDMISYFYGPDGVPDDQPAAPDDGVDPPAPDDLPEDTTDHSPVNETDDMGQMTPQDDEPAPEEGPDPAESIYADAPLDALTAHVKDQLSVCLPKKQEQMRWLKEKTGSPLEPKKRADLVKVAEALDVIAEEQAEAAKQPELVPEEEPEADAKEAAANDKKEAPPKKPSK